MLERVLQLKDKLHWEGKFIFTWSLINFVNNTDAELQP